MDERTIIVTMPPLNKKTLQTLRVLAHIADAYDANELDDVARKFWGSNDEHVNKRLPRSIELYTGRGGKCLLTLQDCLTAREALKEALYAPQP